MQLSTMKCRQPLVQNTDVLFSIDIFINRSQAQNVQLSKWHPNSITEKPPNLSVGCRCHKTLRMKAARPRFDCCQKTMQTRTYQRRQWYPKTPEACLSSLTPIVFCTVLNGHVGQVVNGFHEAHGNFGYGTRNAEGENFRVCRGNGGYVVTSTLFNVTYESGGYKTAVEMILIENIKRQS